MWQSAVLRGAAPACGFRPPQRSSSSSGSLRQGRCAAAAAAPRREDQPLLPLPPRSPPLLGLLAAALLLVSPPPDAAAVNVRLQDVESATLKAGLTAATEGRLEEAERFFLIYLLNEDPNSASAYSNLGNVHQQQGKSTLAVEDYTKAVALAPEASVPYLNRAVAKESLGVHAAASGDAGAALALWRSAAEDCDAAIERDPKEFAAWFDRGNIQMRLEQWDNALTDYSTAADLAPGLAGYRLRHATLLFQQEDEAGSARMMQGIVRKNSNYSEAHAALAAVEWSRGDGERAEEQLVRAVNQDGRWADMAFIRANTRWPPKLYGADRKSVV